MVVEMFQIDVETESPQIILRCANHTTVNFSKCSASYSQQLKRDSLMVVGTPIVGCLQPASNRLLCDAEALDVSLLRHGGQSRSVPTHPARPGIAPDRQPERA
ncbi:hypothetical protein HRG_013352 [Hirsutella rhossiliensis]